MGLGDKGHFQNYHRVMNRDRWSALYAACVLVDLVPRAFAPSGKVHLAPDDTVIRRRGPKVSALGLYRDAVRLSRTRLIRRLVCATYMDKVEASSIGVLRFVRRQVIGIVKGRITTGCTGRSAARRR